MEEREFAMFKQSYVKVPLLLALAAGVTLTATRAEAQSSPSGSYLFKNYCATCHGKDGKGDGPLASQLRFAPADLTLFAKRNGGYSTDLVFRIIDGRKALKGHGGPDMPVWGDVFKKTADGYSEEKVKEKIDALVEFVKTLQVETK
jgi:mono/diheme cytochrome c family protein